MSADEPPLPGMDAEEPYWEWEATLAEIEGAGGATMVLGGTDVGKTTFTRQLAVRLAQAGRRVAILDADPGQSEIGPPACAGLAFADEPIDSVAELAPNALAFIGSISPARRELEHAAAIRHLADLAGDRQLLLDTSGYISGFGALRMLLAEFELVRPAHVVALQRSGELNAILSPLRRRAGCRIHTPAIPAAISRKTPGLRAKRREMRFAAYLRVATLAEIAFQDVAFTGTWLGCGVPVPSHIHRFVNETLGPLIHAYHIETIGRNLHVMGNRPIDPACAEVGIVLSQLKMRELYVTVAPKLRHLLVGLQASNGRLLGVGLLMNLDFRRGIAEVLTPVRTPKAAAILQFGAHRIAPDGTDRGPLTSA
ncbi:MAG TPA: Clp1/GlmU family protein [Chthonomonadaceae bacterium]|nr:Clp1/GlmU family protein [Chthonomonadaceae bacterium]